MLDEKTIEELHSYYDRLPGGICLVKADDSEEILLANAELLNYYQCANWQEFKELTGGTYRGMVEASDYIPLKDIVRVKGQPEANYAYFQFPYRTREGHFNKGNALLKTQYPTMKETSKLPSPSANSKNANAAGREPRTSTPTRLIRTYAHAAPTSSQKPAKLENNKHRTTKKTRKGLFAWGKTGEIQQLSAEGWLACFPRL